jgi:hypothetical protein
MDFVASAAQGTVLVRFHGCSLETLRDCADPHLGTYAPPDTTTPVLDSFDMPKELDVYEKLPLGATDIGALVRDGHTLRLKYVTSGAATSTRPSIYADDLKSLSGCDGATHFVAAYDVGAFALDAIDTGDPTAEAGAAPSPETSQVRLGGAFDSCQSSDRSQCQVPLRLKLKRITPGAGPPP